MKRKIDNFFIEWKNDTAKKPLILFGPSQSGKTYSTINFGKNNYKDYVYINSLNLINKKRIVSNNLADKLNFRESIEDTLIILDNVIDIEYFEICKKFYNDKYNIIIITPLSNLKIYQEYKYKQMKFVDFEEYLILKDQKELVDYIKLSFRKNKKMPFHDLAMKYFEEYLLSGGIPNIIENNNIPKEIVARNLYNIYNALTVSLTNNSLDLMKNIDIFNKISLQLLEENHKFKYSIIKKGGRKEDFKQNILNLKSYNVVNLCYKIERVEAPLSENIDSDNFKLYYNDVAFLNYKLEIKENIKDYKYILYEHYVANTLKNNGYNLYFYQSTGKSEIDFIIQDRNGDIFPINIVKDSKKNKILSEFSKKYTVKTMYNLSEKNFSIKGNIKNIPIYALFCLEYL